MLHNSPMKRNALKKYKQKNESDKKHNENRVPRKKLPLNMVFLKSKCVPLNIVKNYPSSSSITKQALPAMIRVESAFYNNEKNEKLHQWEILLFHTLQVPYPKIIM